MLGLQKDCGGPYGEFKSETLRKLDCRKSVSGFWDSGLGILHLGQGLKAGLGLRDLGLGLQLAALFQEA